MLAMKSKRYILLFIIVIIIILILIDIKIDDNNKADYKTLPSIYISLANSSVKEINENSRKTKYSNNNFELYDNSKLLLNDTITIKGRGNTTWYWPKKPYQISFNEKQNLLDLGASKKWVLLANFVDESLIRNHLAFNISEMLEMPYSMTGKNVNLYIDNEYYGVYYLTNKVSISEGSVNLKDDNAVLVELDNISSADEDYFVSEVFLDHIVFKDFKDEDNETTIKENFINAYNKMENAINEEDWNSLNEIIDVDSFAKYYIICSFTRNGDCYRSSFFMYQDGFDDKIHAGPVWDFDMAYANDVGTKIDGIDTSNVFHDPVINKAYRNDATHNKDSVLLKKMYQFDEFKSNIKLQWEKYMKDNLLTLNNKIHDEYILLLHDANCNIQRWNYPLPYEIYINQLYDVIELQYNYLEYKINNFKYIK